MKKKLILETPETPETPFKDRFRNHKKEFKYATYSNSTELSSKYIWQLKDLNMTPKIS